MLPCHFLFKKMLDPSTASKSFSGFLLSEKKCTRNAFISNTSEITASQNVQLVTMFESSFGAPIMYLGLPSGKDMQLLYGPFISGWG